MKLKIWTVITVIALAGVLQGCSSEKAKRGLWSMSETACSPNLVSRALDISYHVGLDTVVDQTQKVIDGRYELLARLEDMGTCAGDTELLAVADDYKALYGDAQRINRLARADRESGVKSWGSIEQCEKVEAYSVHERQARGLIEELFEESKKRWNSMTDEQRECVLSKQQASDTTDSITPEDTADSKQQASDTTDSITPEDTAETCHYLLGCKS